MCNSAQTICMKRVKAESLAGSAFAPRNNSFLGGILLSRKRSKKIVSLVLAAVMVLTAFPFANFDFFKVNAADGDYTSATSGATGNIKAPAALLVDTSDTTEVVRIAAGQNTVNLPNYDATEPTGVIVKATESGIPEITSVTSTNVDNGGALNLDFRAFGYGNEACITPKVIMKIKSADGSPLPDLDNATVTSPDINNSSFSQPDKVIDQATGWTTYTWTLSNVGAANVKLDTNYIVKDENGAKHMTGMPIQYNISFDLGNRHYEEYAYSVAKEIVSPNGTFMYMHNKNNDIRSSVVTQILSHNMESGWVVNANNGVQRAYVDLSKANTKGGGIYGMGTSGNGAEGCFVREVDKTSNLAKVIVFTGEPTGYNEDDEWDNNYKANLWGAKSYAADSNRTLTTIYMDRNADKPDTLDNLNLRMTLKTGETANFGALAFAQAVVEKGLHTADNLASSGVFTGNANLAGADEFSPLAYTPASRASNLDGTGSNNEGQVLSGYFGDWFRQDTSAGNRAASRESMVNSWSTWGDSTDLANLSNSGSKQLISDHGWVTYNKGEAAGKNYVLGSGNYLGTSDVTGKRYLTLNFSGTPGGAAGTTTDYTLIYQLISSTHADFSMYMYIDHPALSSKYRGTIESFRQTAFTANSFRIKTYDTQALYRLVNWIETGDPLKVNGSHAYSYSATYDGLTQQGINPQETVYYFGWSDYLAAYKEAKRCLADYSITQSEIDTAYNTLKSAYGNLKRGKVKIVVNYRPFDASGNLISSKVITDTFENQPGTSNPLYLGSEFSIGRPKDILDGNYVPKATAASSFIGTAIAQNGEIGYKLTNSTEFKTDRTSDKSYSTDPATATLTFNFDYEPVKAKVSVTTNNGYNLGDTDGEYSESLMYTAKLFSDVTSADTFIQRMLTAIAPFKDAHFHFAGLYSDKALSNVVVSVNANNQPVANTSEEVSVNGNQYYVRWAPDAIQYKVVRAGTETGDYVTGNAENLTADENKVITATVTLPAAPGPLNADDVFVDYYTDAACTNVITKNAIKVGYAAGDGIDAVADANGLVTIYAKFKQQVNAVSFDPNGYIAKNINGEIAKVKTSGATLVDERLDEDNNMTVAAGQSVAMPVPVKTGYIFTGWVTVSGDTFTPVNGWTAVNTDAGTEGNTGIYKAVENGTVTVTSEMISNKVNFVATWAPKTYKAVFCNSQTETSRFSTKETVVDPLSASKYCFGVVTAVVGEPVDLSSLKPAFGGKDYPAAFGKNCAGWIHHATWKRQTAASITGVNFDTNGVWPWDETRFSSLTKDKDGNIVAYIHPIWQTTEDTTLNVYTSLDGIYSTAAGDERVDTADLLEGETRGNAAKGDVIDFRFSVQSGVYASSSSFIFAYDSDFYELPADETLYDNGSAKAVSVNNLNTYIKGIGGANVVHYETVETTANPNILKDLPFNTFVDNGDGTYRYDKSTFGAVVAAANSSSEINAVAPMSNYRLIKVAIDPEVTATAKCVSLTDKNNEYVCSLRLKVKENATGSGAVRFCGELLRTTETVMGDVYIASSKTAAAIYEAKVVSVAGTNNNTLKFQNPDVYSVVELKDEQPDREQYTINLALPYGYNAVAYDSKLTKGQATGATPYFAYTVSNGNLGYTMVSDGETVYYSDAASTEELTVPGVNLGYDAESGKWIVANSVVKIDDNQNCVTGKGEKFTMITLTGDEGVEIGETYYNEELAAFSQHSEAGYTKSPFVGMPEVKRTYVSDITGEVKDAYTVTLASDKVTPKWVELKADGTIGTATWTPGYYATEAQNGKTFMPVWEPATVVLEWYYDKECENIIGTVGTVKYDAKVTKMSSTPKDLYTGKTMAFNVTDGAKSKTYFDGLGYLFSGWYAAKDGKLVCDEKNTSGKSFANEIVTNDKKYYAELAVLPTIAISHDAIITAGEDAVTVDDYSFKLDADMQAALLALSTGVKKDAALDGETILGKDNTVIHIVKDADLNTKFSDTSVNKAETNDFFITYSAIEAYIEGLAQGKVGSHKDSAFGARLGSTEAAKWTAFKENFSLVNADESTEIVFDFTTGGATEINLTFEGKEAVETFEAGTALVPFILSNAVTTNTKKISDTKYESKTKGHFGDAYAVSDTMKLEKDSIFKTLGVAAFTWTNDTLYGVYGNSHTATPKTYQGLTIHYLDKDATAIGTDVSTGSISSLGSTGSFKYAAVPAKLGYTANNWKIVNGNAETFTITANTISGNTSFVFDAVKSYIKDNGTTLDLYLVPDYTQNSYTIEFDLDGGTVKSGSASDLIDKHIGDTVTLPVVEKTGWTFTGWDVLDTTGYNQPTWDVSFTAEPQDKTITLKATWSQSTKSVTFNVNGGTFASEGNTGFVIVGNTATYSCDIAESFMAPQMVPPTGYEFKEWNTQADGKGTNSDVANMTDGSTYYAIWQPKTISITYTGMDGAQYGTNHPASFKYNESATISDPTKTGYTFKGWKVNGGAATKNLTLAANTYASDVTVEADWTANTYTVTLNVNNGTINSGDVTSYTYGVGATLPADVTRDGYDFEGWFDNEGLTGSAVTSIGTTETGNKSFYAKWKVVEYSIEYDLAGGSVATANPTTYTVETNDITLNNPTKTGSTFKGWTGTDLEEASKTVVIKKGSTGKRSYTATWSTDSYTVTLNANNGTINSGDVTSYTYGVGATLPTDVTRDGYDFEGWYDNEGLTGSAVTSIGTTETGNKSFYAKWKVVEYSIEYDLAGGSVATANPTKYTVETNDITLNNPTKTGSTFKGWTGTDLEEASKTVVIKKGSTGKRSYTATWSTDSYTVTLNANDGTINSGDVTSYTYGVGATLPTDVTRDGYKFEGWYANSDLTGSKITSIGTDATGDKEYYAKWTPKTYDITLNVNDGKINSGNVASYTYGVGATLPTDVTKTGYTFDGWYDNAGLTGSAVTSIGTTETGDKEYYAKWKAITGSVVFGDVTTLEKKTGDILNAAQDVIGKATSTIGEKFIGWALKSEAEASTVAHMEYDSGVTIYYIDLADVTDTVKTARGEFNAVSIYTYTVEFTDTVKEIDFVPVFEQATVEVEITPDPDGPGIEKIEETTYTPDEEEGLVPTVPEVNGYIYNAGDLMTKQDVEAAFADYTVKVTGTRTLGSAEKPTIVCGTGTKVEIIDAYGRTAEVYYLVVFGDVNGDACCNSADYSIINKQAADVSYNWAIASSKVDTREDKDVVAACYQRAASVTNAALGSENTVTAEDAAAIELYVLDMIEYQYVLNQSAGRSCYYKVAAKTA